VGRMGTDPDESLCMLPDSFKARSSSKHGHESTHRDPHQHDFSLSLLISDAVPWTCVTLLLRIGGLCREVNYEWWTGEGCLIDAGSLTPALFNFPMFCCWEFEHGILETDGVWFSCRCCNVHVQ
jgi:hypothetical protein